MKIKHSWIYILSAIFLTFFFALGCDKEDPDEPPTLSTFPVTEITAKSAKSGGNITDDGGSSIKDRGVVWSTTQNPTVDDNEGRTTDGEGTGEFTSNLNDLSPGVKYYVRAYATNQTGTSYGSQAGFNTSGELANVTTAEFTDITSSSATSGGNVLDDGGSQVTTRGVVWSTTQNPTVDDNEGRTTDGEGTGEFTSSLNDLSPGVKYYVRAYATNSMGTAYGSQAGFNTSGELASVTTAEVTDITSSSATSGGNVLDDGGSQVTTRGVVWSTSQNPTVDDNDGRTTDGESTGEFSSSLNDLSPGVKYYVRAYATNQTGTSYGSQIEFTTSGELASVTTAEVTDITSSSATSGGNVLDDGGSQVTARGVVWSTSQDPAVDDNDGRTTDGESTGEFSSSLVDLSPAVKYYVRAYATNQTGTSYGSQVEFTTSGELASVTTAEVTDITSSSATSGGNVLDDGGSQVTARGVVWSTSQNPTVDDNDGRTTDGESTGEFSSSLVDLSPAVKYYVRAYATNSMGTAYGQQVPFETLPEEQGVPGPLFVFGFDDSFDSDYYYAYTELKSRGLRGTSFAHTSVIGSPGRLTWEMIHEMVNDGWEMGCHTHTHLRLTEGTEQQIRDEMEMVNSLYQAQGLPIPKHHTYPNGEANQFVRDIVSEYRLSGRRFWSSSNDFSNEGFDFMNYVWVHADMRNEDGQNGLNNVKARVDMAFQGQTVLVSFLIHRLVESDPTSYECLIIHFQQLLDYIIERGGTIVTMNEAYEIIQEYRNSLGFN